MAELAGVVGVSWMAGAGSALVGAESTVERFEPIARWVPKLKAREGTALPACGPLHASAGLPSIVTSTVGVRGGAAAAGAGAAGSETTGSGRATGGGG